MKIKYFFSMALIAIMSLTACSDNNDPSADSSEQSIYLKLGNVLSGVQTRSDEAALTTSNAVTLTDGYIYFITGQDGIKNWYKISATESTDIANKVIKMSDLNSGYKFENVSGEVEQVYVVGNPNLGVDEATKMTSPTTLTELKKVLFSIEDQGVVTDLTIDGIGAVEPANTSDFDTSATTDKQAIVSLTPLCSRIEIAKVTASGDISQYTLTGIFTNQFYSKMALNSTPDVAYLMDETTLSNFSTPAGIYTTYTTMFDNTEDGLGVKSGLVTTPANGAWAYQFFTGATDTEAPRVVLKMKSVIVGGANYSDPQYLNVRGFLNGTTKITTFERGKVYKITDLQFVENNLSDIPDPEDINLWVKVSITPWTIIAVNPEM